MTKAFSGILGAVAVSLTFGAVQLAAGSDVVAAARDFSPAKDGVAQNGINRATKSDLADLPRIPAGQGETISVRVDELSATSILIRLPARQREEARSRSLNPVPSKEPVNARKSMVACESMVSVLTEVAKLLQPGRCIT